MGSVYTPDKWVIIGDGKNFKVFGSWSGGYLDSDNWRLSSGLQKVETDPENENVLLLHNYSGSVYKGHKKGEGIAGGYNHAVLNGMLEKAKDEKVRIYSVEEYLKLQDDK